MYQKIFARILFSRIALKGHISDVKNSRLRQDSPISIYDRVILPFREGLFSRNFADAKFCENKVLAKISEFIVVPLSNSMANYTQRKYKLQDSRVGVGHYKPLITGKSNAG